MKVTRGQTIIEVPHLEGNLQVIHPFLQGTYFNLAKRIDKQGLQRPTMAETVSLIHDAYKNPDDDEVISDEIKSRMKNRWFYTFNGILYTPQGAFLQDNPEFTENASTANDLIMNESDLKSRLGSREEHGIVYSDDGLVRFVPYGFKRENQSPLELSKNSYVIALAGEEGADKLAYIASKHNEKPYLNTLIIGNEPVKRVAALDFDWYGGRLSVDGNYLVLAGGCSFGVAKNFSSGNKA